MASSGRHLCVALRTWEPTSPFGDSLRHVAPRSVDYMESVLGTSMQSCCGLDTKEVSVAPPVTKKRRRRRKREIDVEAEYRLNLVAEHERSAAASCKDEGESTSRLGLWNS